MSIIFIFSHAVILLTFTWLNFNWLHVLISGHHSKGMGEMGGGWVGGWQGEVCGVGVKPS